HAGHRVGAVDRALRAANQFDARGVVGGQVGEIVGPAGIIHRRAVDQDFGVIGLAAANEERGRAAAPARLRYRHAGRESQRVEEVAPLGARQFVRGDDERARRRFVSARLGSGRRNDYGVFDGGDGQRDRNAGFAARPDLDRLRAAGLRQPISFHGDGVVAWFQTVQFEYATLVGERLADRLPAVEEQNDAGAANRRGSGGTNYPARVGRRLRDCENAYGHTHDENGG